MNLPQVGIIMGSISDKAIMIQAAEILDSLSIPYEMTIVSAHRTPERMMDYAKNAREKGLKVIIAGAGGAAHLPGMVASVTTLPVIGVPIQSKNSIQGWDSLLSIVQMPGGIPVATMAVNGSLNAGLFAARILGCQDQEIAHKLQVYKEGLESKVLDSIKDFDKS
jgi:5-(carboxyamino)imidazole ribonucleotide mutase